MNNQTKKTIQEEKSSTDNKRMNKGAMFSHEDNQSNGQQEILWLVPCKGTSSSTIVGKGKTLYINVHTDENSKKYIPVILDFEKGEVFITETRFKMHIQELVSDRVSFYDNPSAKSAFFEACLKVKGNDYFIDNTSPINIGETVSAEPTEIKVLLNGKSCPICGTYNSESKVTVIIDKDGYSQYIFALSCKQCKSIYLTRRMYELLKKTKDTSRFYITFINSPKKSISVRKRNKKKKNKAGNNGDYSICPYCNSRYQSKMYVDKVSGFGFTMCPNCLKKYKNSMNE